MNAKVENKKNVQGQVNEETAQTTENAAQSNPEQGTQGAQTPPQAQQDNQPPKESFLKKVKRGVDKVLDYDPHLTPRKLVIGAVAITAGILGIRCVYNKGKKDGAEDANFENTLTGGEEPLMIETAQATEYEAQPANDEVVDVEEYTEYEEAEEYTE